MSKGVVRGRAASGVESILTLFPEDNEKVQPIKKRVSFEEEYTVLNQTELESVFYHSLVEDASDEQIRINPGKRQAHCLNLLQDDQDLEHRRECTGSRRKFRRPLRRRAFVKRCS